MEKSRDGHMKHTVTQVTKTSFDDILDQPLMESVPAPVQEPVLVKHVIETETWQSEQDTSQVSVSSLPEDEKSEPTTATVSSTASTTTGEGAVASAVVVEHTDASSRVKVSVEQKGKNQISFDLV